MASGSLTQDVRFPGQLEDSETSLTQNWNRDYDPYLGRYVQSDPIGLMGGINMYGYAHGNSLTYFDFVGEAPVPHDIKGHGHAATPTRDDVPIVADTIKGQWCGCGSPPGEDPDIDFVFEGNQWIKMRGDLHIKSTPDGYTVDIKNGLNFPVGGAIDRYIYTRFFNEHKKTPKEHLNSLNNGELRSIDDSCVGFFQ